MLSTAVRCEGCLTNLLEYGKRQTPRGGKAQGLVASLGGCHPFPFFFVKLLFAAMDLRVVRCLAEHHGQDDVRKTTHATLVGFARIKAAVQTGFNPPPPCAASGPSPGGWRQATNRCPLPFRRSTRAELWPESE